MDQTQIYLTKRSKVILPVGEGGAPLELVSSLTRRLLSLGFGVREDLLRELLKLSFGQLTEWHRKVNFEVVLWTAHRVA
jgi:hypothetical protein